MAARKLESFGSKLIDKMMAHVADDVVEKLEAYLVCKACGNGEKMVNVGELCSSLIRQKVLDENDIQLRVGLLELDAEKWTKMAMKKACSKKAIGSLVVALQCSGNEGIVQEAYEWLENASKDPRSHTFPTELDTNQAVVTNHLILHQIFEHLYSMTLSRLALVNKLWKKEATSLLRQRDNLDFFIKSQVTCSSIDLEFMANRIMQLATPMEISPVHGIKFNISPHGPVCPSRVVVPNLETILAMLSLKSLDIHLSENCVDHQNCPPFKLARGLLEDLNGSLADLQLRISSGRDEFLQLFQNFTFTHLKILRLEEHDGETADEGYINYIRALVSLSPNLQQLHLQGNVDLRGNFLGERQPEVLVHPRVAFAPYIAESLMGSLRLKLLNLLHCTAVDHVYFQRFMRTLPVLLGTCCSTTLTDLQLDPVIALSLMSQGVALENLSNLHLTIDYGILERLDPRILENFKKFDFMRVFPKLSTVTVCTLPAEFQPLPDHVEQLIEGVANLNARPDPAVNVTLLLLADIPSDPTLDLIVQLFPRIQGLGVGTVLNHEYEESISFGSIWKQNWTNLTKLHIRAVAPERGGTRGTCPPHKYATVDLSPP